MDGSLTNWYGGQPVITEASTGGLVYWYGGQPYTIEDVSGEPPPVSTWTPKIIMIN